MAKPYIEPGARVLDIGCFDHSTWNSLPQIRSYTGIDPNLTSTQVTPGVKLIHGLFPDDLHENEKYDLILMLAVIEHIPIQRWPAIADSCYSLLDPHGKLVMTVPAPTVDKILYILKSVRLIDGMDLENHQHVDPAKMTPRVFGREFRPLVHRRFQLGLNHLFVYERV